MKHLAVACLLLALGRRDVVAQQASAPGKFGFFGNVSVESTSPVTLFLPAGSPFGVAQPRSEIGTSDRGVGGSLLVGLAVNRFGFFGTMEFLRSGFDEASASEHYGGGQFMADLGIRYDVPFFGRSMRPYVIGSLGYFDQSYKYGDPTVIIGPGGGYSSGQTTYDGRALSYGVGLELGQKLLARGQAARRFDVRLISTNIGFNGDPGFAPEDAHTIRLLAGMTWWVRSGLR